MRFSGSFVPLLTPFDRLGRLDKKTLEKLVLWHISEGTDGIVCSATTGEGPCLTDSDKKSIAKICIETAAGRVPVIVSTGVSDTRTTVRNTEMALKLGASGCLVVTPYYNKPSQRGCVLHFSEVAKVGLPVIVYHNPTRAGIRLTAETIVELSHLKNIVALKDSSHDLELIAKVAKQIDLFAGDDDITFEIMKAGGVGSIGTAANLVPKGWKIMIKRCLEKKWEEAERMAARYLPLCRAIFLETNPQCHKFALSWLGRCYPYVRLPMVLPTEATQIEIKREILRLALPQYKQPHLFKV